MDFPFAFDDDAQAMLPSHVTKGKAQVVVADASFAVQFGELFNATVDRASVEDVTTMLTLDPITFLPLGVSAAVQTLGGDTISVLGSHQGLVRIDLKDMAEGRVPPPEETPNSDAAATHGGVRFRHLIVSVTDPDGLVSALRQPVPGGTSQTGLGGTAAGGA